MSFLKKKIKGRYGHSEDKKNTKYLYKFAKQYNKIKNTTGSLKNKNSNFVDDNS